MQTQLLLSIWLQNAHSSCSWLLGCPGNIPRLPNCSLSGREVGTRRAVTGGHTLEHSTAGEEPIRGHTGIDAVPSSRAEFEELPFARTSDATVHNSLRKAPTHTSETRCQGRAKRCKDSSRKGKIPYTADDKASGTSLSQGNSAFSRWTHAPSSGMRCPAEGPTQEPRWKVPIFASLTQLAPAFRTPGASAKALLQAQLMGGKGKAGIGECYSREVE